VCFPLVEYLPVKETAAPKIILSPTTFEKEIEVDPKIKAIAETNIKINLFNLFIYFLSLS
jgi:hypothetical protein